MGAMKPTTVNLTDEQKVVLRQYARLRLERGKTENVSVSDAIREIIERDMPRLRQEIEKGAKGA